MKEITYEDWQKELSEVKLTKLIKNKPVVVTLIKEIEEK